MSDTPDTIEHQAYYEALAATPTSTEAREAVLKGAEQAVLSDRNANYGNPEDNFRDIATLWNAWLKLKYPFHAIALDGLDVAQMMIHVKQARMRTSPLLEDHHVDIAGYAACGYAAAVTP